MISKKTLEITIVRSKLFTWYASKHEIKNNPIISNFINFFNLMFFTKGLDGWFILSEFRSVMLFIPDEDRSAKDRAAIVTIIVNIFMFLVAENIMIPEMNGPIAIIRREGTNAPNVDNIDIDILWDLV